MGEYAVAKTSVWWDIENCGVPRSCDAQLIVQNMSSALATAGYRGAISVSAYGDTHQIAHNVQHALSSTGVSIHHVPAGIKDASDKRILVDMLFWAIDNPPPANYLLISGDRDFSHAIHKLKMRRYNILLAQPPNVSQTLTAAAKSVWLWKSLLAGEPPLAQSPYISSTSSGNKYDLDKSKNIVSNSSAVTRVTNPRVQNVLCDPQSDANSKADTKYEVKQPREMETDNVSKQTRRMQKKRSKPEGTEFTKQTVFKKSKGGFVSTEQSKSKQPEIGQLKPVRGQGLICFKCGDGHVAARCTFNGDCHLCGRPGHKDRVCKENPNSIVKWMPAHAKDLATSSLGSVQITSSASQLHPTFASPLGCSQQVAPAPPETGAGLSSGPSPSGVYSMLTAAEVGREDVARPTKSTPRSRAYKRSEWQSMICLKCGVVGHRGFKCTYIGACPRCGQGHMERVCRENPDSIIKWKKVHEYALDTLVPSFKQNLGVAVICLKCGVVGHRGSKCTYNGACRHCGQGHMERVCKENPDSIINWEQAYALATSSQGLLPPPGSLRQGTPVVATPSPSPAPAAPAPPHTDVAASSAPAQSGVYASPTVASLGKPDVVMQQTSSSPSPAPAAPAPPHIDVAASSAPAQSGVYASPTAAALGKPDVVMQQTSSSPSPAPAAPAPPHTDVAASSAPAQSGVYASPTAASLGKPDVVMQQTSSSPCPPTALLAYQQSLGQYHQGGTSQLLPAWTPPPGCFWQATPAVPAPSVAPAAPAPPHTGVAASSAPTQSGVYATPTAASLGKPDVVTQPTSSAPRPPTALLAYRPVLGQYHQVNASQLLPAWTPPPGYFWRGGPVVPSPHLAPLLAPVPPQPGVAASPRPAHFWRG